jgi:hypothetical protein
MRSQACVTKLEAHLPETKAQIKIPKNVPALCLRVIITSNEMLTVQTWSNAMIRASANNCDKVMFFNNTLRTKLTSTVNSQLKFIISSYYSIQDTWELN